MVSVWAGVLESEKALRDYFDLAGHGAPSFSRDFFGGCEMYPFDIDFSERGVHKFTADPKALLCPYSEGTAILKKLFRQGLEKPCNAAILIQVFPGREHSQSQCAGGFSGAVP